ncbi:MAG TPA: hypothetical protein VNX01_15270 [Bacteroidia bacterium]|nr:hypothetical protein [Bacteroidia bacterium]
MRLLIAIILTSVSCFAQSKLVLVFNFDSTKIYIKYDNIKPYITEENKQLNNRAKLIAKNDTLFIDRYFLYSNQHLDSLSFDLDKELFIAINNKKATVIYKGKTVTAFYKEFVKQKIGRVLHFKGYYYYDALTKKQFLAETLYQKNYCMSGNF